MLSLPYVVSRHIERFVRGKSNGDDSARGSHLGPHDDLTTRHTYESASHDVVMFTLVHGVQEVKDGAAVSEHLPTLPVDHQQDVI